MSRKAQWYADEALDQPTLANSSQIVILEAMKLEIAVKTPDSAVSMLSDSRLKVEKLLVKPGDTVSAGGHLALVRKV